jgi:hypothetical protein
MVAVAAVQLSSAGPFGVNAESSFAGAAASAKVGLAWGIWLTLAASSAAGGAAWLSGLPAITARIEGWVPRASSLPITAIAVVAGGVTAVGLLLLVIWSGVLPDGIATSTQRDSRRSEPARKDDDSSSNKGGKRNSAAAVQQELFRTIKKMEDPNVNWEYIVETQIQRLEDGDLSWNLLDDIVQGWHFTPETMVAYRKWRAAKLAEPSTPKRDDSIDTGNGVRQKTRGDHRGDYFSNSPIPLLHNMPKHVKDLMPANQKELIDGIEECVKRFTSAKGAVNEFARKEIEQEAEQNYKKFLQSYWAKRREDGVTGWVGRLLIGQGTGGTEISVVFGLSYSWTGQGYVAYLPLYTIKFDPSSDKARAALRELQDGEWVQIDVAPTERGFGIYDPVISYDQYNGLRMMSGMTSPGEGCKLNNIKRIPTK